MRKYLIAALALTLCVCLCACSGGSKKRDSYKLTEDTFFLVMTNMQYYPEQYLDSEIEFDCFTYALQDVDGNNYLCGVRKCSAGYGCTCGNDTIIGFILNSDVDLPKPRNQSENSVEKAWVHLKGRLKSAEFTPVTIHAYLSDGSIDPSRNEQIKFLQFNVESCEEIEDYSNLAYYVTK